MNLLVDRYNSDNIVLVRGVAGEIVALPLVGGERQRVEETEWELASERRSVAEPLRHRGEAPERSTVFCHFVEYLVCVHRCIFSKENSYETV